MGTGKTDYNWELIYKLTENIYKYIDRTGDNSLVGYCLEVLLYIGKTDV